MISDAHSYLEHNIWEADAKHPLSTLFSRKKLQKSPLQEIQLATEQVSHMF